MLFAYISAHTGRTSIADDVFQKTMLEAWACFDKYDPQLPPGPWLRGIARNMMKSQERDDARVWRRLEKVAAQRLDQHFDYIEEKARLEFAEVIDALNDCLRELDPLYRAPLQSCYWAGLSVKDTAKEVGLTLEACKKRLQRGREMLRSCMTGKGVLAPPEASPS